MQDMAGKKILVISSDSSDIAFVEAAHELNAYVICCDRYTDWDRSPAKKLADAVWDIDYNQTEKIAAKCKKEGVNGVIAGYSEDRVLAACRIAEAIGSPFYATEEQIELTRDKIKFKELCAEHGILTPREYSHLLPLSQADKEAIVYPVIIKPSDSGGRKGISICDFAEQLDEAIDLARSHSKKNEIVIEEYLSGIELSAIYTLVDGEISLSCLNDKYISQHEGGRSKLCNLVMTPSSCYHSYLEQVDQKVKNLLHGIGAENGVANLQFLAADSGIKAFEMGYRVNGNDDFKVIRKYNDIDFVKMLLSHSLTGSMGDSLDKDDPEFPLYSATLILHVSGGVIATIDYEALKGISAIDDISLRKTVGSSVSAIGTNQHKAMMIKLSAATVTEIVELIYLVQTEVKIENTAGENMLLPAFDLQRLREKYKI